MKFTTSAIAFLLAAFVAVEVNCACFNDKKMKEDSENNKKMIHNVIKTAKEMCKDKSDFKECCAEKVVETINEPLFKMTIKQYISDESKEEAIKKVIEKCYQKKAVETFPCYVENIVKLCPEATGYADDVKRDFAEFF